MNFGRPLGLACAVLLTAAACAQEEPIVLSDAPQPSPTVTTDREAEVEEGDPDAGRFIARCATEADGDTVPGLTIFTDGTENVTDYCLRRFYVGVQPRPGLVYVPDNQAGYDAPSEQSPAPTTRQTWTPSEPRTDRSPTARPTPDEILADGGPADEIIAAETTAQQPTEDAPAPTGSPAETPTGTPTETPVDAADPTTPTSPATPVEETSPTEVPVPGQPSPTTPTSPPAGQSPPSPSTPPAPGTAGPTIPSQLPWYPALFPPLPEFQTQIPAPPGG